MIIQEIRTIDELLQFMNSLNKKHGARLWYRGEENASLTLVPSIQRSEKRLTVERYITNDFYIRARQILDNPPAKHNYAAWVSLMQHYGLPTRMLDWSESPLIAAFFATETYRTTPKTNAGVWVLAPDLLNEKEGFGRCIYPIDADTTQEMLLPAFKHNHHNPELVDRILACSSTENNLRMYSQHSNFTVHNSLFRDWRISAKRTCSIKLSFPPTEKSTLLTVSGFSVLQKVLYTPIWTIFPAIYGTPTVYKKLR